MALKAVQGSGYGNVFIDSLIWGGTGWNQNVPIKVSLGTPADFDSTLLSSGRVSPKGEVVVNGVSYDKGYFTFDNEEGPGFRGTGEPWSTGPTRPRTLPLFMH